MTDKTLFPQIGGLIHGCDYNPEQWLDRPDILKEDIRMMRKAGINCVTLGVFSWAAYEPRQGEFHFDWLLREMDELYENGVYTVLATPTGARPAWLDRAYPEAMRVNRDGSRNLHGLRHNHCPTSPAFRERAEELIRRLAKEVRGHPGLILWHISNELGGECFCPLCREKFREYLRRRFDNDIEKLNRAWWTAFWSHTYGDFDEIDPPMAHGESSIMGLNLAWREFTSWNMGEYIRFERELLNRVTPGVPVTTNFMRLYGTLDYQDLSKNLDVVSWDSYPDYHNDRETLARTAEGVAFDHAVMRGMKRDMPFLLMESTPSLVNWHSCNKLKRPGVHRLSSLQAVACGADSVQYFQWRKGRGSYEQYHGAVVDHLGTDDTRVFREVAEVGELLKKLRPVTGSVLEARAAVLFDWSNRWAVADLPGLGKECKKYEDVCRAQYACLRRLGVETDVVSPLAGLDRYALVAAPMLYLLKPGTARRLTEYVRGGGRLVMTYLAGYVDETALCFLGGFPGDGLRELFGVCSEEIDTLYPSDRNRAVFSDGEEFEIRDLCEVLRVSDAETLAVYGDDFYAGTPVVTRKRTGRGEAWYAAARIEDRGMERIYRRCLEDAGVELRPMPEGIEYHQRRGVRGTFGFYLNHTDAPQQAPAVSGGRDLLSGAELQDTVRLEPYGAAVVEENLNGGEPVEKALTGFSDKGERAGNFR